jgi:hypothetical protein
MSIVMLEYCPCDAGHGGNGGRVKTLVLHDTCGYEMQAHISSFW